MSDLTGRQLANGLYDVHTCSGEYCFAGLPVISLVMLSLTYFFSASSRAVICFV